MPIPRSQMSQAPRTVYARNLLPLNFGYPLWSPEPRQEFLARDIHREGITIGDVGVTDPDGGFDVFFNICLPSTDRFHQLTGVPENFTPVSLGELDTITRPYHENPGRVVSSTSVTTLRMPVEQSDEGFDRSNHKSYEFNFSASEGALLILPKGSEGRRLCNLQRFEDAARRCAADWYKFAQQHLGRHINQDSIYLITGYHKTRAWSVASFHRQSGATQSFPATFREISSRQGDISGNWETGRRIDWRTGPAPAIDIGMANQAVFITGFKIALRSNIFGRKVVEVDVDIPSVQPARGKSSRYGGSTSLAANLWRRLVPGGSRTGETTGPVDSPASGPEPETPPDTRQMLVIEQFPQPSSSKDPHPSDVINRYLLRKEPSAIMAIVHDRQWGILLQKGLLKPEDLFDEGQLVTAMSANYRFHTRDGVVSLKAVNDCSAQLLDIDEATRSAWKEDKLADVEELLSKQVINVEESNTAYSYRALVRARLRRWDAALSDAEMSNGIRSSVIGYIAMGFALFGKREHGDAMAAFDAADRDCATSDKSLVSVIKAIVLFEAEYHEESMACIADLIERGPVKSRSASAIVQAKICLQLATFAMKNEHNQRALQLLEQVHSLEPSHDIPELNTVSLVTGWKFGNLRFSIYQLKCQVLYSLGRTSEVTTSLQSMRDELRPGAAGQEGANWFTTFTQQCVESLERLGDTAMSSQNYSEASMQYSAALAMDPRERDGLLIKRSRANAEAGDRWQEALNDANEAIVLNPLSHLGYEMRHYALRGMKRVPEANQALLCSLEMLERSTDPHSHLPTVGRTAPSPAEPATAPGTTDQRIHNTPLRLSVTVGRGSAVNSISAALSDGDIRRATELLEELHRQERDVIVRLQQTRATGEQHSADLELHQRITTNEELACQVAVFAGMLEAHGTPTELDQISQNQLTDLVRGYQEQHNHALELMKAVLVASSQEERRRAAVMIPSTVIANPSTIDRRSQRSERPNQDIHGPISPDQGNRIPSLRSSSPSLFYPSDGDGDDDDDGEGDDPPGRGSGYTRRLHGSLRDDIRGPSSLLEYPRRPRSDDSHEVNPRRRRNRGFHSDHAPHRRRHQRDARRIQTDRNEDDVDEHQGAGQSNDFPETHIRHADDRPHTSLFPDRPNPEDSSAIPLPLPDRAPDTLIPPAEWDVPNRLPFSMEDSIEHPSLLCPPPRPQHIQGALNSGLPIPSINVMPPSEPMSPYSDGGHLPHPKDNIRQSVFPMPEPHIYNPATMVHYPNVDLPSTYSPTAHHGPNPMSDTLNTILYEHRLGQVASIDLHRELMKYMANLNDWLGKDVQDRQTELKGVTARLEQLSEDLARLAKIATPVDRSREPAGAAAGLGERLTGHVRARRTGPRSVAATSDQASVDTGRSASNDASNQLRKLTEMVAALDDGLTRDKKNTQAELEAMMQKIHLLQDEIGRLAALRLPYPGSLHGSTFFPPLASLWSTPAVTPLPSHPLGFTPQTVPQFTLAPTLAGETPHGWYRSPGSPRRTALPSFPQPMPMPMPKPKPVPQNVAPQTNAREFSYYPRHF